MSDTEDPREGQNTSQTPRLALSGHPKWLMHSLACLFGDEADAQRCWEHRTFIREILTQLDAQERQPMILHNVLTHDGTSVDLTHVSKVNLFQDGIGWHLRLFCQGTISELDYGHNTAHCQADFDAITAVMQQRHAPAVPPAVPTAPLMWGMTREALLDRLRTLATISDVTTRHIQADLALLDYLNDPVIAATFSYATEQAGTQEQRAITREALLRQLWTLREETDPKGRHADADAALLAYINDEEITLIYDAIEKWYA